MLTWAEVCARRLARHGLLRPLSGGPAGVAAAIAGVHAQVPSAAELSIGLRLDGVTRSDVRAALADRTLVRTRGPRGTVHLLATVDLPMWTAALAALPRARRGPAPFAGQLSPAQADEIVAAIADALFDGDHTVDELTAAIVRRVGAWAGELRMEVFGSERWPVWRRAEQLATDRGVMCFGPARGRLVTYTRPPEFTPADPDAAHADLLARYLHAYGPATPADYARWLSTSAAWAERLFAGHPGVEQVEVDDRPAWQLAGDKAPAEPPAGVRLLPLFDAYVVGAQPRDLLFPGRAWTRARAPQGGAGNFAVLLIGGVVAGVWHQKRSGRKLAVTVEPLRTLGAAELSELDIQVQRVADITEATATWTIGIVTVGRHA